VHLFMMALGEETTSADFEDLVRSAEGDETGRVCSKDGSKGDAQPLRSH
jgi:hypothetical protein